MIMIKYKTKEEEIALVQQYTAQGYKIAKNHKLKSGNSLFFREPSAETNLNEIIKVLMAKGILTNDDLPPLIAAKIGGVK